MVTLLSVRNFGSDDYLVSDIIIIILYKLISKS